nr:MAG TPA: hypothetical protein [Caudoviricetes sp.]
MSKGLSAFFLTCVIIACKSVIKSDCTCSPSKAWVLRSNRNGITYKTQLIAQYKLLIFSCVFAFYKQDVFHIRF